MSNRILIGALSGWQHVERRERCVDTWMPDARKLGMDAVFLLGIANLARPERHGDLLLLPCPDDYPSLPKRTRWFCQWALTLDTWDYLFKCDDDTYVAASRLATYDLADRDYVGAEWSPGVGYGSGGAGYFLSRRAATIVAERLIHSTGAEDALVGQVLREVGIPLSIEPRLIPFGNNERRPQPDNDLLTLHGVNADLFYASHCELVNVGETHRVPQLRSGVVLEGLRHLAEDLPKHGHLVEIGAFAGESTRVFLEAGLHVDAIDPWDAAGRDQLLAGNVHEQRRFMFDMRDVEAAFDQRVAPFADRLRKLRGRDEAFVERYADNSLDTVYIDSVHTSEHVRDTIGRWWSKLRVGGVLAGHDYSTLYPGVLAAVQEAFGEPDRVYADTSWAAWKRARVVSREAPRVGFLFLITDGLTQPDLWREWLDAAGDRFGLFVHCKHPEQLSIDWLREHLIREYVPTVHGFYWPHNAIAKAQVALLRAGLADQSITKLAFISQSTIPIVSPDEVYDKLTSDDKSWIDREGFCEERYLGLKPGVIPREHYQKSSNWLILNRRHAWQCVTAEAQYMDAFVNSPAADEHYFHTMLSIQGIDYGRETWPRCGTYVDWQRGSPFVFETLTEEDLATMREQGFLFARKFAINCHLPKHTSWRNLSVSESRSQVARAE